jgi:hypothetical protein
LSNRLAICPKRRQLGCCATAQSHCRLCKPHRRASFDHLVGAAMSIGGMVKSSALVAVIRHSCTTKLPISNTVFTRLLCWAGHERASALRPATAHCRSLISHNRPAVFVSCASGLGGLRSWSKKYTPLTFATSGEVASHTRVSAPFSGLRDTGLRIVIPKPISRPLLRLNPVATSPGWKQFAVTPVPSRRRASSVVNRMLASLVSQ